MTADNKQINKQWRLKARPVGAPDADTWEYTETDLPTISDGELLKLIYLNGSCNAWLAKRC